MRKMVFALALVALPAHADMYKCTIGGVVAYQAAPCASGQQSVIEADKKKEAQDTLTSFKDDLEIGAFSTQVNRVDSNGAVWFSYKVGILNKSDINKKVDLRYKAVDYRGFMIKEVYINGTVPDHSYRILTDDSFFNYGEIERVSNWVLDN